jgi:acid phosphatase
VLIVLSGCAHRDTPNLGLVKKEVERYYESGRYNEDVGTVTNSARIYIESHIYPGKKNAIVLDIDDTAISSYGYEKEMGFGYTPKTWKEWELDADAPAIEPVLDLFNRAKEMGVHIFFVTGRREKSREETTKNLERAGYSGWDRLYMKPDAYRQASAAPYKTAVRKKLTEEGYNIIANIGDQRSDLEGGYAGKAFQVPNPMYHID